MEENFDLLAQSRANYYVKGSPVQFVKVELLKGDVSGDIAVCLSFKNITSKVLNRLAVSFKCKDRNGAVVCQDNFVYSDLSAADGEVFGQDDAVFISTSAIGSVEVDLQRADFADGTAQALAQFNRVRLPAPKKLPAQLAAELSKRTQKADMNVQPQVLDEGWYCACGAFHPREERGVWCSECGADRVLLQNTLSSMMQGSAAPTTDSQPTRMANAEVEEPTRAVPPLGNVAQQSQSEQGYDDDVILASPRQGQRPNYATAAPASQRYAQDYDEDEEEIDPRDETATLVIRWAPVITAGLCICIALIGFIVAH